MTDLTTTRHSTPQAAAVQKRAPALISEQQVLFGSAAAALVPPATTRRWADVIGSAVRSLLAGPQEPAKRHRPQHYPYLESALMAREMGRL